MAVACTARPLTVRVPKLAPFITESDTWLMFIKLGALARLDWRTVRPLPWAMALMCVSKPTTPAVVLLVMMLVSTPPAAPTPAAPKPTAPAKARMRSRLLAVMATESVKYRSLTVASAPTVVWVCALMTLTATEPCTPAAPALMPTAIVSISLSLSVDTTRSSPLKVQLP